MSSALQPDTAVPSAVAATHVADTPALPAARNDRVAARRFMPQGRTWFLLAYFVFALLPIYWMVNMSFKTNGEILTSFTLLPQHFTWDNYRTIFTDPSWYSGYINSMIYVAINTVISITVALPAAYAFSRYQFLGDKHVFFWLLTNRMTPPAVFFTAVLPALQHARHDGHAFGGGARTPAVQRAARGLDFGRLHERHSARDRRDRVHRRLFVPAFFFCGFFCR